MLSGVRRFPLPAIAGLASALPITAQSLEVPSTLDPGAHELAGASALPFMVPACRIQVLYAPGELGGNTNLLVSRVSLRFDGPTGGGARPHAVQRLSLRLGATQVAPAAAGSIFAANLSQPLAPGLTDVRLDYLSDARAGPGPEPFGGPGGQFVLPLAQPVAAMIPGSGALAVEIVCAGNDNTADAALLDLYSDPGNLVANGKAASNGRGCPVGPILPGPVLDTVGAYEPGGSFTFVGHGFLPAAPVVTVITANLFASPLALTRSTPICWAYVDTGTTLLALPRVSTATGELSGGEPVPIPKRPAPAGAIIYVQGVTLAEPSTGGGLASTNYRTIQFGLAKTPAVAAWTAVHESEHTAPVATAAFYGALALRLE